MGPQRTRTSKFKVFVSRPDLSIPAMEFMIERGCELVKWTEPRKVTKNEMLPLLHGVDAIFCIGHDVIDNEAIETAGPTLKVISTCSVGYNHIDLKTAKARGIRVGNTLGLTTGPTAELTVALLLTTSRRLLEGNHELLNGKWVWSPTWLCGRGLKGSTVGIFGLGDIGQAVLRRLVPFGPARFVYACRTKKPNVPADFVSFDELLRLSDFIIVTAALNEGTREIFDEKAFDRMKPDAIFINTSRGGLVKQEALVDALKRNRIRAAGLDVMTPEPLPTDHELTKLRNCVLIPHMGTQLHEATDDMLMFTARNIVAALNGEDMPSEVEIH